MEFEEEFYSPRPPIKHAKTNPRIKRAVIKEKIQEGSKMLDENKENINQNEDKAKYEKEDAICYSNSSGFCIICS